MINNNENTKVNVKETENGTVMIKMSDFYPSYCGEQEFCEVSREFYEEFYAEKKQTPVSVTVTLKELYPHLYHKIKQDTITLPKKFYDELMAYRKENGTVAIWLDDYYPRNHSAKEYVLVSKEVYLQLNRAKNKEEYVRTRNRKMYVPFGYEEIDCSEIYGIYTESNVKNIDLALTIRNLFMPYGQDYSEIAVRYFIDGESPTSIAENMKKSRAVVWKALRKIKDIVKDVGYSYFT